MLYLNDDTLSNYVRKDFLSQLREEYVRREFAEFDYIKVKVPGWIIFFTWLLVIVACVLLSIYAIGNEYYSKKY